MMHEQLSYTTSYILGKDPISQDNGHFPESNSYELDAFQIKCMENVAMALTEKGLDKPEHRFIASLCRAFINAALPLEATVIDDKGVSRYDLPRHKKVSKRRGSPASTKLNKDTVSKAGKSVDDDQDIETDEEEEEKEEYYIVDRIFGHRIKENKMYYHVKWQSYSEKTWEPEENLGEKHESVIAYWRAVKAKKDRRLRKCKKSKTKLHENWRKDHENSLKKEIFEVEIGNSNELDGDDNSGADEGVQMIAATAALASEESEERRDAGSDDSAMEEGGEYYEERDFLLMSMMTN